MPRSLIVGQSYHRWKVLKIVSKGRALVRCDCGAEVERATTNIALGTSKSCGCWRDESQIPTICVGDRLGRLTVLERLGKTADKKIIWLCLCDCGKRVEVRNNHLLSGASKSCGCLRVEITRKRQTKTVCQLDKKTKAYKTWWAMVSRCHNPGNSSYKDYGGRGIRVCRRWIRSPDAFFADMGHPPEGLSIERINNNKGYSPNNCKWATTKEQMSNTRRSKKNRVTT